MADALHDLAGLCRLAAEEGAVDARIVRARDVVVSDWVRWKCRFGCDNYGRSLMCPPRSPTPQETRALLEGYEHAVLVRLGPDVDVHKLMVGLERKVFLKGYASALALTAGPCRLCEQCNLEGGICLKPFESRPSMEACGIDVFTTARNAGYGMNVLTSRDQPYHRIGLLMLR